MKNKRKIVVKPIIHQNSAVAKALSGKLSLIINMNPENYYIPRRKRLLGQTTMQPLSILSRGNFENKATLRAEGRLLLAYNKISVVVHMCSTEKLF